MHAFSKRFIGTIALSGGLALSAIGFSNATASALPPPPPPGPGPAVCLPFQPCPPGPPAPPPGHRGPWR